MPRGQLSVAKQITSRVVKSGARKLSFSISLGQGSKGITVSELATSFWNFSDFALSTIATQPSK
jgi:hypothetical protein